MLETTCWKSTIHDTTHDVLKNISLAVQDNKTYTFIVIYIAISPSVRFENANNYCIVFPDLDIVLF
jgi:hypothetical protein